MVWVDGDVRVVFFSILVLCFTLLVIGWFTDFLALLVSDYF